MKLSKGKIIGLAVLGLIWAGVIGANLMMPYAITVDGNTVVVVENKDTAKTVLKELLLGYVPEDTEIKSISIDKDIDFRQMGITETIGKDIVRTDKEAIEYLANENGEAEALFSATVQSEITKEEKFTPEPDYVKDDKMFAGEEKVVEEAKKGVQNVTYAITSVNGQVQSQEATGTEVITEGKPAVIHKGTLGLPSGKDWKTYTGDPVYKNGKEVATTAQQYLGRPYKYGGTSLTNGIDCVQYVRQMYKKYGISIPNSHGKIRKVGKGVSYKNAQPGDIICYKGHVGIYVGNGKMANAVHKGTRISKVKPGKIVAVRRVVQ